MYCLHSHAADMLPFIMSAWMLPCSILVSRHTCCRQVHCLSDALDEALQPKRLHNFTLLHSLHSHAADVLPFMMLAWMIPCSILVSRHTCCRQVHCRHMSCRQVRCRQVRCRHAHCRQVRCRQVHCRQVRCGLMRCRPVRCRFRCS